jgi:hypothetical protein
MAANISKIFLFLKNWDIKIFIVSINGIHNNIQIFLLFRSGSIDDDIGMKQHIFKFSLLTNNSNKNLKDNFLQ